MSRAEIAAEAASLEPGQSVRTVCPFCGGGSDSERCLSIRLDAETGLILYHCFRGSCNESGILGGTKSLIRIKQEPKKKPAFDTSNLYNLWGDHRIEDLWMIEAYNKLAEWQLDTEDYPWAVDIAMKRLAIPVLGPRLELRGYVLRAIFDWQKPKALTGVIRRDDPFIAWLWSSGDRNVPTVCVEDVPSALRVREAGFNAVAFLGNTPSTAALDEVGAEAPGSVVFAFDADATAQAIRVQRQYGLRGESSVLVLTKDFKNMTQEEANECLMSVR